VAAVVRVLLLSGCRVGEALSMRWADIDFASSTWHKRPAATKQGRHHSAPMSAPLRQLLAEVRAKQIAEGGTPTEFVFPGKSSASGHYADIHHEWRKLCQDAGIADLRLHDLRHSFASELASSGSSLLLIGSLLGHSSPTTTARYSHLFDDPQRAAVERVGAVIDAAGKGDAKEPVPFPTGGRHGH
jgi:integrase